METAIRSVPAAAYAALDREYMGYCDRCGQHLAWELLGLCTDGLCSQKEAALISHIRLGQDCDNAHYYIYGA